MRKESRGYEAPRVLFSYASPQRLEPDEYQVTIADLEVLRFRFRVVQLNQLDWRAYLKQSNPVATALMSRMRIAIEDRPRVKAECLRLLLSLRLNRARTALITGFVDTYLRLNGEEEARFKAEFPQEDERQAVMELLTSWEERGVERGMREMLQGVLVDRFGARAQEFSGRLEGMPMSHLRDLRPIAVTGTWDEIVKALEAAC